MALSVRSSETASSRPPIPWVVASTLLLVASPLAAAQGPAHRLRAAAPLRTATVAVGAGTALDPPGETGAGPEAHRVSPVLLSALLPGAGQYVRDERRWVGYVAAEALAWFFHLDRRSEGRELRDRYRELAWQEARQQMGPRVVGDFEYYERLSFWSRSGGWDVDAEPGLQPETDPATYNGMIWQRARGLFFGDDPESVGPGDPAWEEALDFYRDEAYGPELLWDWTGANDERRRFDELIEESDDHLSTATTLLGIVLLNHVASAADAFISGRLDRATGGRVESRLGIRPVRGALPGPLGTPRAGLHLDLQIRP